jgi:hypothetical protein
MTSLAACKRGVAEGEVLAVAGEGAEGGERAVVIQSQLCYPSAEERQRD